MGYTTTANVETSSNCLSDQVFRAIRDKLCHDAEDVAAQFEISDSRAIEVVDDLLRRGLIEFDDGAGEE